MSAFCRHCRSDLQVTELYAFESGSWRGQAATQVRRPLGPIAFCPIHGLDC